MHLGGEIFRHGVANSASSVMLKMFEQVGDAIKEIQKDADFRTSVRPLVRDADGSIQNLSDDSLDDHLYTLALPTIRFPNEANRLIPLNEDQRYCFIVAFQALRLVALLHDVGHPPFSHVTEDALIGLDIRTQGIDESSLSKTAKQRLSDFRKLVLNYMENTAQSSRKFHESLGLQLCSAITERIVGHLTEAAHVDRGGESGKRAAKKAYDFAIIAHFAGKILESESNNIPLFIGLHSIVDGDLDCDRLDYVIRDLFSSGIYTDTIQYDRLLTSYSIVFSTSNVPTFTPSTRALSTIEDFFWQRLFLYRYVVFHHRVIKMDGLLRESLAELGYRYLTAEPPFETDGNASTQTLPFTDHLVPHVSGLWKILGQDQEFVKRLEAQFSQWDDSWLLTVLRQHYFCDQEKLGEALSSKLKEILSNEKCYISLVKRGDIFLEIDEAFFSLAQKKPELFKPEKLAINYDSRKPVPEFDAIYNTVASGTIGSELCQGEAGFFLSHLLLLKGARFSDTKLIFDTAESFRNSTSHPELFIVRRQLKPGISHLPFHLVSGDGKMIDLNSISRLNDELRRTAFTFPPFFVYVRGSVEKQNESVLRRTVGERMFKIFEETITKSNL